MEHQKQSFALKLQLFAPAGLMSAGGDKRVQRGCTCVKAQHTYPCVAQR